MHRLHPYWLWAVLALPAAGMAWQLATATDPRILHVLVHPTGEWAARLLILTLMATPLMLMFRGWRWPRWLVRHRRHLGVASFGYAAAHLAFYLADKASLERVAGELSRVEIWTGWLAFVVFLPLAATSSDAAVRALGRAWKPLQRWVYAAAVLVLVQWAALHDWASPWPAIANFAPLVLLSPYRVWWLWLRPRPALAA